MQPRHVAPQKKVLEKPDCVMTINELLRLAALAPSFLGIFDANATNTQ